MSASLFWQPIKGTRMAGGSTLAQALKLPRTMDESDLPWLAGARAMATFDQEALDELSEAIGRHGKIRVWAEY